MWKKIAVLNTEIKAQNFLRRITKGSIMKVVNFSWSSFHKKFDRNFAFGTIGPYSSILE